MSYIQEATKPSQWRYVPTKANPADIVSRGIHGEQLNKCELWWQGPEFLMGQEEFWPTFEKRKGIVVDNEERKTTGLSIVDNESTLPRVDYFRSETVSKWRRLIRVRAWIRRFADNSQAAVHRTNRISYGELTPEEIQITEMEIIREDQKKMFRVEIDRLRAGLALPAKSKLLSMNPKLDEMDMVRSNSRLIHAEMLAEATRSPIILARDSWVTWLIIGKHHDDRGHCAGVSHLLSDINQSYWIPSARKMIKMYERRCLTCRRNQAKETIVQMAPLPRFRFAKPCRPFGNTAVDFAGPYETICGRGKTRNKRYMCLFTCMQTRAVHLEVAMGLDTDAFICALTRFIARRGKPAIIVSDNGTNFVGTCNGLKEIVIENYKLEKIAADQEIKWIFNPPTGSHFGGIFEAMIKSAKRALRIVLGDAKITDDELVTMMSKVEGFLNSRPLTPCIDDPKGSPPFTPNDFLLGSWRGVGSEELTAEGRNSQFTRWRQVQVLWTHFWERWKKELVPMWAGRAKWRSPTTCCKVGDVVWSIEKDVRPGSWHIGRILEVFPGADGLVRVVKIESRGTQYIRPVVRVFPLEVLE